MSGSLLLQLERRGLSELVPYAPVRAKRTELMGACENLLLQ